MLDGAPGKPLVEDYSTARSFTDAMSAALPVEDQIVQSMPDVSPTKWHLAHTSWFWETFVLIPNLPGYAVFDDQFGYLFNSYYEAVGARHTRPERGLLTRPDLERVRAYRGHIDRAMTRLLADMSPSQLRALTPLIRLGLAHEEQHQELILMDIKHVLSRHPFGPAGLPAPDPVGAEASGETGWIEVQGGLVEIGAREEDGFAFDNEGPRHKAWLEDFLIADQPVSNGEYADFIADGGYETASLWLSEGWAMIQDKAWRAPLYWRRRGEGWMEFTLHGEIPLNPAAPVVHLSYFEAAAYAEWAGARLPEEGEWEIAALRHAGPTGRFARAGRSAHPGASPAGQGMKQAYGGVWEWTRSAYCAYPGFRPAEGAVGEYNGKFMCGQFVLKGGSCATPPGHVRASYRNFFPPDARWAFSGLRLARDR